MGMAKRLWEEEQGRGYSLSDKFVCVRCFDDYAIKEFIKTVVSAKQCSFCGLRNQRKNIAAPGNAVLEFILRGINSEYGDVDGEAVPYDGEEGRYMVPVFDIYDIVHEQHSDISSNEDVLDWIVNSVSDGSQWCQKDPVILSPEEGLVAGWEDFSEAIKHGTRYLFFDAPLQRGPDVLPEPGEEPYYVHPAELLDELANVVKDVGLIRERPSGTNLFRVRPHALGVEYNTPIELGPPPEDRAKAGRMSAAGIVVFYGALEEATALAETERGKPSASVGTFSLLRSIKVLDLVNLPPIPSIFDREKRRLLVPLRFLYKFRQDISAPIEPDDRMHIEYTPTQVVTEFIKLRFRDRNNDRVGGILYPSSRNEGGRNLVLFVDRDNIQGIATESYREPQKLLTLVAAKTIELGADPATTERIRRRAYELFEKRCREGAALQDWLQAEAEILRG